MEDAASESEIGDWEVLSAASRGGGGTASDDDSEVVVVSGGGGDVLHDHFALAPAGPGAGFPDEGPWPEPGDAWEGIELLDRFDPIPEASFDLAAGVWSEQLLPTGGVDEARGGSILETTAARGTTWGVDGNQAEAVDGASLQSPCPEDAVASDGIHGEQEEQEHGANASAASSCDEPDREAEDGALPLAHTPGTAEGDKQVVVWWRLPFRLLHCCAWKVKPVWSFSIAAALLGLVVLGRRMYKMKRKAKGLPQIKIAFDDKRTSRFADRAARLNEAFLVARRVPLLRTSAGAVLPWSMVQER
ncbi:uncharacterized protein LOC120704976 isoform X2 [Panicum virgatum]|uniref:DUF6821 domain-containing protein n=1 Tax=Panicum virgatum TaxID=38727 RepID=A0A8T0XJM1_PANVG|nr:uncharacterized protein LOC120704976 isoform X2 [Panicum virgatum]KAG2659118.1 hypothetical protein PVAP13_1KG333500 [Panicum virgatum]